MTGVLVSDCSDHSAPAAESLRRPASGFAAKLQRPCDHDVQDLFQLRLSIWRFEDAEGSGDRFQRAQVFVVALRSQVIP
jgi:hypothetical protein